MRVTVLANGKGGCGKTTLATTLASALAVSGRRVALADADAQRSSLAWLARRPIDAAPIGALDWTVARPQTVAKGVALAERALDWLIVDAPADLLRNARTRRRLASALERADNIVAPTTPSPFDMLATRQFLAGIEAAPCMAGDADILLVANRLPKKARAFAAPFAAGLAPVASLYNRSAYRKLAEHGLGLFDSPRGRHAAIRADEWRPLLSALAAPIHENAARRSQPCRAPLLGTRDLPPAG